MSNPKPIVIPVRVSSLTSVRFGSGHLSTRMNKKTVISLTVQGM